MPKEGFVISIIVAVCSIVGTCYAISSHFLSQGEFDLYKEGRIQAVDLRLDRIEIKLDYLIQHQKDKR